MNKYYGVEYGDRVDLTTTAVVSSARDDGITLIVLGQYVPIKNGERDVTVKKHIPPLPTVPGSVVRSPNGDRYSLRSDRMWSRLDDDTPVCINTALTYEILYDAGAE